MNASKRLKKAYMSLVEAGANKITVKALCEEADLSKQTFYRNYNDREELMEECLRESVYAPLFDDSISPNDRFYNHLIQLRQNGNFMRNAHMLAEYPDFDKCCTGLFKEALIATLASLNAPVNDPDFDFMIKREIYAYAGIINEWMQDNFSITEDQLNKSFLRTTRPEFKAYFILSGFDYL